jgi:hypothetical protein
MTNLVSLNILNAKGVHWNSKNPQNLYRNDTTFCNLEQIGHHWVLEKNTNDSSFGSFAARTRKSKAMRHATFTEAQLHRVLGHASPEVISHVAGNDITIDKSSPTPSTIECEIYSRLKAIEIVSWWIEVEDQENGIPFDCMT